MLQGQNSQRLKGTNATTANTKQVADERQETIIGAAHVLRIGMWSGWVLFVLFIVYFEIIFASGASDNLPNDLYWAIAEIVTIVGAPLPVILFAVIYDCAPVHHESGIESNNQQLGSVPLPPLQ